MVLRKRIVARPRARRPPTEPLVPLTATCSMVRVAGAFLLLVLLTSPGGSASDPGAAPASAALAASVSETPDAVQLRIQGWEMSSPAGDVPLDVVLDRLREVEVDAGDLREPRVHGGDQPLGGDASGPLLAGLQVHEVLQVVGRLPVGAVLGAAELAEDASNLGKGEQGVADGWHDDLRRTVKGDARRERGRHPEGSLVQVGQELRAEPREQ